MKSLLFIILLFMISSCSTTTVDINNKMDALLKEKISEFEKNNSKENIVCLIEFVNLPKEHEIKEITELSIEILNSFDRIISCEGAPNSFKTAAAFKFIKRIELSREYRPKKLG